MAIKLSKQLVVPTTAPADRVAFAVEYWDDQALETELRNHENAND